jgi:hypothetical protein
MYPLTSKECEELHEKMYNKNLPVTMADLERYWFYESKNIKSKKYPEKDLDKNSPYQSAEEIIELEEYCKKHEEYWTD